jgi:adenylate cyclase
LVKGKKFESDFKSPLHRGKEKQQVELLLQFLESSKNYCVCVVDMVGSTSIAMGMSNEKIGMYYGAFLNMMAEIASSFGATVVKNIGDSLLYYFPKTDSDSNEPFTEVLKCSMVMIQKRPEINTRMHIDGLPDISYRISCEYGSVIVAKMSTSSVHDIFGNSVNLCSKINLLASPNSIVIGKGLYQKTKSFNEYVFTKLKDTGLSLGRDYQVYSVSNKN